MSKAPPTKLVKLHTYVTEADVKLLNMLSVYFGSSKSDVVRSAIRSYAASIVALDAAGVEKANRQEKANG